MKVEWDGKSYEFVKPMLVARLLEELSLNRDAHLVVANNKLVTEDYRLEVHDDVKVIRVISGG
jgi:sulfur carrier protein ThiS